MKTHLPRWLAGLAILALLLCGAQVALADQGPRYWLSHNQVSDSNGKPLASATLTFTVCGTTTPLDTFSDASLGSANANPLTADSAGRFGDIFLQDQAYRAVLKNSAGTAIFTEECIYKSVTRIRGAALPSVNWPGMEFYNTSTGDLYRRNAADSAWIDLGPIDSVGNTASVAEVLAATEAAKFVTPFSLAAIWGKGTDVTIAANNISLPSTGGKLFVVTSATTTLNSISSSTDGREIILFFQSAQTIANGSGITTGTGASLDAPASSYARLLRYNSGWQVLSQYQIGNSRGGQIASVSGLIVTNNAGTPNTKTDISADNAVLTDVSNKTMTTGAVSCTVNFGTTGAGGLDTGVQAVSTWYSEWIIEKPDATVSCLASTSSTAPTMPSGYSFKMRVGWMYSNGSTQLAATKQYGAKTYYTGGAQTVSSTNSLSNTSTSIATLVPTTARYATVGLNCASNSNGGAAASPSASYGTSFAATATPPYLAVSGIASTQVGNMTGDVPLETAQTLFLTTGTAGTNRVLLVGWVDKVNAN